MAGCGVGAEVTWRIDQGDCREPLQGMPAESVHIVVTSPPYWGLRDYGLPPLVWGGAEGCEHEWGEEQATTVGRNDGGRDIGGRGGNYQEEGPHQVAASQGAFCRHCHAWRGSLGLEPTPELYIEHMVEVFREVWRVLRRDGTLFVNMGDSYASGARGSNMGNEGGIGSRQGKDGYAHQSNRNMRGHPVLKPKDLCGMPWRLAFALQADGWWLRSEIIWSKPNPMPESVRDRPTKAHETVFLLTKAARYFYDQEAVREPHVRLWDAKTGGSMATTRHHDAHIGGSNRHERPYPLPNPAGRNRRTVWTIPTAAFPGPHFATFPPKLIEPMILTSPTKCCAVCGTGWERVTEKSGGTIGKSWHDHEDDDGQGMSQYSGLSGGVGNAKDPNGKPYTVTTLGFRPACDCPGLDGDGPWGDCAVHPDGEANWPTVPATALDPFVGSGTTIMVALRHDRNAIGLELSKEYAAMARRRIVADSPMFNG